jgi:hypothetical protein
MFPQRWNAAESLEEAPQKRLENASLTGEAQRDGKLRSQRRF